MLALSFNFQSHNNKFPINANNKLDLNDLPKSFKAS